MTTSTPTAIVLPEALVDEIRLIADLATTEQAALDRIGRAAELVKAGSVTRTSDPQMFLVISQSEPDTAYRVHSQFGCHCRDTDRVGARECKHFRAVRMALAGERVDAEQSDPTNVAALQAHPIVRVDPEDSILDLWPGEPCDLPAQCARCHAEPICHNHRDGLGMACIADELGMGV